MKKYKLLKYVAIYLIIVLFTYTAVIKILDYNGFVIKLLKSSILPKEFVQLTSFTIPTVEVITVVLLLYKTYIGLYVSFTMLCIFTLYLILLNKYSNYSGCSCGGILDSLSFKSHLVFNLIFILINLVGIYLCAPQNNITLKKESALG